MTADNGAGFHGYKRIERHTGAAFYFARPYHSWERGSNEQANGLILQYLPKGASKAGLSQQQCNAIARKLNTRPRKRLGFRTPLDVVYWRPCRDGVVRGGAGRASMAVGGLTSATPQSPLLS